MTDEQLREIEERANAATPGPWYDAGNKIGTTVGNHGIAEVDFDDQSDMAFCVHAREDIPALIAEIRRLKKLSDWATKCDPSLARVEVNEVEIPEMPEQLREMLHEIPPTASGFGEIPNRTLPQPPDSLNEKEQ